jgi:hypothetical protein
MYFRARVAVKKKKNRECSYIVGCCQVVVYGWHDFYTRIYHCCRENQGKNAVGKISVVPVKYFLCRKLTYAHVRFMDKKYTSFNGTNNSEMPVRCFCFSCHDPLHPHEVTRDLGLKERELGIRGFNSGGLLGSGSVKAYVHFVKSVYDLAQNFHESTMGKNSVLQQTKFNVRTSAKCRKFRRLQKLLCLTPPDIWWHFGRNLSLTLASA